MGQSLSALLELGATIDLPSHHPLSRPWNELVPQCQVNHLGSTGAWDAARYVALVKEVEEANLDVGGVWGGMRVQREDAALLEWKYHNMVLGGKFHAAVQNDDKHGRWGILSAATSGRPVIDMFCEKHPESRVPPNKDFNIYPDTPYCLNSMPVYCYEDCIGKAAACLLGSTGPFGVKAEMLKHCGCCTTTCSWSALAMQWPIGLIG